MGDMKEDKLLVCILMVMGFLSVICFPYAIGNLLLSGFDIELELSFREYSLVAWGVGVMVIVVGGLCWYIINQRVFIYE